MNLAAPTIELQQSIPLRKIVSGGSPKIALVSVEDGLITIGFRKVGAYIKRLNPETTSYYVSQGKFLSLRSMLTGRTSELYHLGEDNIREMAEALARADLVGFSSMTGYAALTAEVIRHVRLLNPRTYIVWGGIHPIIVPEDAIKHADAICTGEGEFAFAEFYEKFKAGQDYTKTNNFWFRNQERIIKNGFRQLMTNEELDAMPLPQYGEEELIYTPGRGYVPLTPDDYISQTGLCYHTVWSIGCPFKCTYCGNTKFIENDRDYMKLRHPRVRYIIDELKQAIRVHPHISTVVFEDDSFMALPTPLLTEFAKEYRKHVGIPFYVAGVIPNYVRREKIEVLLSAGLNRIRMGIQNGSEQILKFYERPTPPARILESAAILSKYSRYMIPPAYDIIVDNPVETKQDILDNLELLYRLARPYNLNIYSLRLIPNTALEQRMKERNISLDMISAGYEVNAPTFANCLVYLLAIWRIPRWLFTRLAKRALPILESQPRHLWLFRMLRTLYLTKRALNHLRFMDFSIITGKTSYFLWKIGLITFWHKSMIPKFALPLENQTERTVIEHP